MCIRDRIFIVPPAHVHILQAASMFVYAVFGIVTFIFTVRIGFEEFRINDLICMGASNRKGISHYCPLWLTKQAKYFTHIMNKTCEDKPVRMAIGSYSFRSLKQVLQLVQFN